MGSALEALKEYDASDLVSGVIYDDEERFADKVVEESGYSIIPPLKHLRPIHVRILAFHLTGIKGTDIVKIFKQMGIPISYFTVYRTIHDPLSKPYIQAHVARANAELRSLDLLAVDAVRDALVNGSMKERLMGVDRVFKSLGRFQEVNDAARETAEDVIARALDVCKTQAETVRDLVRPNRIRNIIDLEPEEE